MIEIDLRKKLMSAHGEFVLDVQLKIQPGEFIALFGQSGAGKSTLMRCLAGLDMPDAGMIRVNGQTWYDSSKGVMLPARLRRVGFMFQDYALFPNMSVRGNLEFALRKGADKIRVNELIDLVGLGELQHRKPASLSGGQKQRVALARALASDPGVLLLDEPFSALDHDTGVRLQSEVLRVQQHFGITSIMVSHDISEVYRLAQRVAMIANGRVSRLDTPAEIFRVGQSGGNLSFAGEVLKIETADVVFAVTLLVGNQVLRVIATPEEASHLRQGDRVMLMSKAFNPVLQSVSSSITASG